MNSDKKTLQPDGKGPMPPNLLSDIQDKGSRVTRNLTKEAEKDWKEYYLTLPIKEKREVYHCGKKYNTIDTVKDWPTYAATDLAINKKTFEKVKPLFEIDDELNSKISLWRGDITTLEIDVICNAANKSLLGGGGVDGAIHRAAGKKLLDECSRLNGCNTGYAKLTGGYKLPAKYILHTVGPIGEQPEALRSCYLTCLNLAKENKLRTLAVPCISTGIYGYDVEKATPVVMEAVREWLLQDDNIKTIDRIIFCVFLSKDVEVYEMNLLAYFPVEKPVIEEKDKKKEKEEKAIEKKKEKEEKAKEKKEKEKKEKEEKKNKKENKVDKQKTDDKLGTKKKEKEAEIPEKKRPKTTEGNDEIKSDKDLKTKSENNSVESQEKVIADTKKRESERNEVMCSSL